MGREGEGKISLDAERLASGNSRSNSFIETWFFDSDPGKVRENSEKIRVVLKDRPIMFSDARSLSCKRLVGRRPFRLIQVTIFATELAEGDSLQLGH